MLRFATLALSSLLLSCATASLTAQAHTYTWHAEIELGFVEEFQLQWNDKGSGAKHDGSFWNAVPPAGFHIVGSTGRTGYDNPGKDSFAVVVRDVSHNQSALAKPTGYTLVWADHGSGAHMDGSMWQPIAPPGYVAMGLYCQKGYHEPSTDAMRCVRRDLVEYGAVDRQIWNDSRSGAKHDFAAWEIAPNAAHPGFAYVSANTFVGHASHHAMPSGTETYVFQMSIQEDGKEQHIERPRLTSNQNPGAYANTQTVETTVHLPWFAVKDPILNATQRISRSPQYRLVRRERYKLVYFTFNDSNAQQSPSVSYTEGFSQTDTQSFEHTTGVSIESGFSAFGADVKCTLSYSFTYGTSSSRTTENSRTIDYPMTVQPGTAVAVYAVESTYTLYRQDGSIVGGQLMGTAPNSVYYTSWPSADVHATPGK